MKQFVTPQGTGELLREIERLQSEYPDKRFVWEVRPYKKPRSLGLNSYAWGYVITPMANHIGESPAETWRNCCGEYFGWVPSRFGQPKPRRTTTTDENGERDVLPWDQMSNFVEFCKAKAADIGCPLPNSEAA